jgi:hypothetical protein
MKKALAGTVLAIFASTAYATITHNVVIVDNSSGRPTDFDYYTFDLRFIVRGNDDWTTSDIIAEIDADEVANVTWNPRTSALRPPAVEDAEPSTWSAKFRNMVSTPQDWPNTLNSSNSTLGTVANDTSNQDKMLAITWFDTSTVLDPSFTGFRLTLRQTVGLQPLTLANTGDRVALVKGRYAAKNTGGTLFSYEFGIYRVPEPTALALLALGGLAGLIRRR